MVRDMLQKSVATGNIGGLAVEPSFLKVNRIGGEPGEMAEE